MGRAPRPGGVAHAMLDYLRQGLWRIDAEIARHWAFGRAYGAARSGATEGRLARLPPGSLVYGETPWRTMRGILDRSGVGPGDRFVECGSGTGRLSLFVNRVHGIPALGIEVVPAFVDAASRVAERLGARGVRFVRADFLEHPWSDGTIFYLAATALGDEAVERIERKCAELRDGARIAIVTHRLRGAGLVPLAMDVLDFSWGPGTVFVYRKVRTVAE